jgi:PAT family beta-lactamase induction signal transducer AmpG
LYFLQGIPQGLIYFALLDWLAGNNFSIKDIAIVTVIASIPWSLKFLIGPFVDRFSNSLMGKRRPWIITSTILMSITLIIGSIISDQNIDPTILGLILFSTILATSTLDVATDGLAIDILDENERGFVNGLMWAFRTLGMSISAIFSSVVINIYGLSYAMLDLGIIIIIFGIILFFLKERQSDAIISLNSIPHKENENMDLKFSRILSIIVNSFSNKFIFLLLLFCLTSNLASGIHFSSVSYLYINYAEWESYDLTKLRSIGLYGGIIAALIGGYLSDKINPQTIIKISQIGLAIFCFVIGIYIEVLRNEFLGISILLAFSFFNSFGMTAVLSLCMKYSITASAASLFAIFMSARHLSRIGGEAIVGIFDGIMNITVNNIYLITSLICLLPLIFLRNTKRIQ